MSRIHRVAAAMAALMLFAPSWASCTQSGQAKSSVFGLSLDKKAAALLVEVERAYGRPIQQEWLSPDDPMSGRPKVGEDGAPIISINPSHGLTVDVVVHELYHFKLRELGYAVVLWLFPQHFDTESNRASFDQLRVQLYDPILHYVFYPEARALLGIDPGKTLERRTREALEDGSLAATFATMDRGAIALYFFKIRLELESERLFKRLVATLQKTHNQDGIEFGEQLVRLVQESEPASSPSSAIGALVECLDTFYAGKFRFKVHSWTSRQRGSHSQAIVSIELVILESQP